MAFASKSQPLKLESRITFKLDPLNSLLVIQKSNKIHGSVISIQHFAFKTIHSTTFQMLEEGNWRWDVIHAFTNVLCLTFVVTFVVAQLISLFRKAKIRKRSMAATQPERKFIQQARMTDKQVTVSF